jgi:hypothetical protein
MDALLVPAYDTHHAAGCDHGVRALRQLQANVDRRSNRDRPRNTNEHALHADINCLPIDLLVADAQLHAALKRDAARTSRSKDSLSMGL